MQWLLQTIVDELMDYRTTRQMRVRVWQLGVTHRLMQLAIIIWVLVDLNVNNSWAYSEVPTGDANAWEDGGRSGLKAAIGGRAHSEFRYCSNASYDYVYSASYQYLRPRCRELQPEEAVVKGFGSISFTTSIIERHQFGWHCNATDGRAQSKRDQCAAVGATILASGDQQCECSFSQTYYVLAIENMQLAFEHTCYGTEKIGSNFHGISNTPGKGPPNCNLHTEQGTACTDHPLRTAIRNSNEVFDPGNPSQINIKGDLSWFISLASNYASLDDHNEAAGADQAFLSTNSTARFPPFRTTGMLLKARLRYDNLDTRGRATFWLQRDVRATLEIEREDIGWAGTGAAASYPEVCAHVQFGPRPART
jgi:hypothetical protein